MVSPLAQAYVGDLTPRGKEGQYTNLFCSSQFIGMAIGPLLGEGSERPGRIRPRST